MNLASMRDKLKIDLGTSGTTDWNDPDLNRAVERAVDGLNRVMPRQGIYDTTLDFGVTAEAWTASHDTAVSLANGFIKWATETVYDSAGTTCARDTDYTIDYANGTITALSTSSIISDAEACTVDYTKSKIAIDISSISNLMRVTEIEYPYGYVPVHAPGFHIWNDFLIVDTNVRIPSPGKSASQVNMSAGEHIWIYYKYKHTAPTEITDATYETYLDEVILGGAGGYALISLATKQEHEAKAELGSSASALGNISDVMTAVEAALDATSAHVGEADIALDEIASHVTDADTALDKVATYVADANSALDTAATCAGAASSALGKVDTYSAGASGSTKAVLGAISFTPVTTALDLVAGILNASGEVESDLDAVDGTGAPFELADAALDVAEADSSAADVWEEWLDRIEGEGSIIGADAQLQTGDGYINTVNTGSDVPEHYRRYAQMDLSIAAEWRNKAMAFIQAAAQRVGTGHLRISQAQARINQAMGLTNEASQRLARISRELAQADGYDSISQAFIGEGAGRVASAQAYIAEANQRLAMSQTFNDEASQRLAMAATYRDEAVQRLNQAQTYHSEANQRLGEVSGYVAQAAQHQSTAEGYIALADMYRAEGNRRYNQFQLDLADRSQRLMTRVRVSHLQHP